jgi:tetratricopeptide (TPR) repeat protein
MYVWVEAARSFNEALRADPDLAMAYLGLSYALTELNQTAAGKQAAQIARSLGSKAGERERLRIDLRLMQLDAAASPNDSKLEAAYRAQLARMLERFPDDVEMLLIAGRAPTPTQATHGMHARSESLGRYERALKLKPNYFATHHYLTHAYENTGRLNEALEHGALLVRLAPNVPHAHHMYAHVLRRVGRMTEAIAELRKADDLETAYLGEDEIPARYDWHFLHNLELLGTSYQYLGKMVEAESALRRAWQIDGTTREADELNKKLWPMFLMALGRPVDALAAAEALIAHPAPLVQALGYLLTGRVSMALGDTRRAADLGNEALQHMRGRGSGGGVLVPEFELTQGEYLLRTGASARGAEMLLSAITKIGAQSNPDSWLQTLFSMEDVGRIARELENWGLAGEMTMQMQARDSDYAGTQYALGRVAEHAGDRRTATAAYERATQLWKDADPAFRDFVDARQRLERLTR